MGRNKKYGKITLTDEEKYILAGKDYALNDASRSGKLNKIRDEEKFGL